MSEAPRPTTDTIVGVGLLLFGVPLAIVGLGHLVRNGSCSSTGVSDSGASLPFCPRGEGFWILFLLGGICVALAGAWVLARRSRAASQLRMARQYIPLARQWMAAARQPPADVTSQLEALAALHEQGALTDAEFAAAKRRLIG
jgi:hypothetical protein